MVSGKREKEKQKLEEKQKQKLKQEDICYPNLPHKIIVDILTRLPVSKLTQVLERLNSLWKSWGDLIWNPRFIKMHLQHASTQNNHVSFMVRCAGEHLLSIDYDGVRFGKPLHLDFPYGSDECPVDVLGSCNGLFLLRVQNFDTGIHYCFWNPSTREYKELPDAGNESDSQKFGSLSYHHVDEEVSYGWNFDKVTYAFGYNNIFDDYNIVRVVAEGDRGSRSYTVDIYTLGSNSWRRVGDIPYVLSDVKSPGVLVNGAIHWVGSRGKDTLHKPKKLIVSLDLGDEKYKEVPLPCDFDNRFGFKVVALGGCLCVINFGDCYDRNSDTDVWMMKDYGVRKSWSKFTIVKAPKRNNDRHGQVFGQAGFGRKGSIASSDVGSDGPSTMFHSMLEDMKLIATVDKRGIILKDGKQYSSLLYSKTYERVKNLKNQVYDFVEPYVGSLVSLKSRTYCERREKEEGWSDDDLNSEEEEEDDEEDDDEDEDEEEEDEEDDYSD